MPNPLTSSILAMLKEGLAAYKTFLATRQEAYNRSMDKKQVATIEAAEKYIMTVMPLIEKYVPRNKKTAKPLRHARHYHKRFFHCN